MIFRLVDLTIWSLPDATIKPPQSPSRSTKTFVNNLNGAQLSGHLYAYRLFPWKQSSHLISQSHHTVKKICVVSKHLLRRLLASILEPHTCTGNVRQKLRTLRRTLLSSKFYESPNSKERISDWKGYRSALCKGIRPAVVNFKPNLASLDLLYNFGDRMILWLLAAKCKHRAKRVSDSKNNWAV